MYRLILIWMLSACVSQKDSAPDLLYGHTWASTHFTENIHFTIKNDGKMEGYDGCNRIFGKVAVGQRLDFGKVASTKMACGNGHGRAFWEAIQKHDGWRIRQDQLQLLQGKKVILSLQKVAQAADEAPADAEE